MLECHHIWSQIQRTETRDSIIWVWTRPALHTDFFSAANLRGFQWKPRTLSFKPQILWFCCNTVKYSGISCLDTSCFTLFYSMVFSARALLLTTSSPCHALPSDKELQKTNVKHPQLITRHITYIQRNLLYENIFSVSNYLFTNT